MLGILELFFALEKSANGLNKSTLYHANEKAIVTTYEACESCSFYGRPFVLEQVWNLDNTTLKLQGFAGHGDETGRA